MVIICLTVRQAQPKVQCINERLSQLRFISLGFSIVHIYFASSAMYTFNLVYRPLTPAQGVVQVSSLAVYRPVAAAAMAAN